jgi:hypothetical protein
MGKLITYGIIALIVLSIVFFGIKYPDKFISITGAAVGWTKDKVGNLLDKTNVDNKIVDKVKETTSNATDAVVNKIKTEGITALSGESVKITVPDENGINQTYTCVKNGA